jgi:hypothetical protein
MWQRTEGRACSDPASHPPEEHVMAQVKIARPDGRPSPYFWNDKEEGDKGHRTVYKTTVDGIKRMRGVHFDAVRNKLRIHS